MSEKHLRELLKEEQEPFLLKHYISERRSHLKRAYSPSSSSSSYAVKDKNKRFGLNKCLQNATKSPVATPKTTPRPTLRPSNAKTATLLLEAALRIHKPKPFRLGLLGSLFRRLTARKDARESCSCNARPSSALWSDSETCTTDDSLHSLSFHHPSFCQTPFRFSLLHSSATHHPSQDKEINGADGVNKFPSGEEEEDKEQCSPVSVLDPPFDDDDDEEDDDGHENDHGEDGFDLDCSYANVQRTKLQLLDRLQRFEKLAELDPIELQKRMLDQEEFYETFIEDETCEEKALREEVSEILCHSRVHGMQQNPEDLKKLVYDLIMEEETEVNSSEERNMVMRRVCRRLKLWNEVQSNTIDMMIEEDFSSEEGVWKRNADQTRELALELEHAIFCCLVEELSEELVS
ncbi:hypothetical protein Fmac_027506 [Flemingia macrophylla]|uniref:DUF4378 domain-containing protein n=1 Tax=Flemingia macrophylla TaxID=520843 RepID=A0ABD1LHV1_9FABA